MPKEYIYEHVVIPRDAATSVITYDGVHKIVGELTLGIKAGSGINFDKKSV